MRLWLLSLVALFILPAQLAAQGGVRVDITLPSELLLHRDPPGISVHNVLSERDQEKMIRDGFPAKLSFLAELWPASGVTGRAASSAGWDVIVDYEPLDRVFRIVRITKEDGYQSLGSHATFDGVREMLARSYQPRIRAPVDSGRYYYTVRLDVERMTANDLEDLRSWLGTDNTGRRNAGSTIVRVIASIVTRLLGAQTKRYQGRTPIFTVR